MGKRLNFLENYVLKTLRIKQEKWSKMITTDIYKEVVIRFIDEPCQERLIFSLNAASLPIPSYDFPLRYRSKIVFFVRQYLPSTLTRENIRNILVYGDMLPNIFENLVVLFDETILPLLNNRANQYEWPSVIVNDMNTQSQDLRNCVAQMKGKMINRIILPLPICIEEVMEIFPAMAKGDFSRFTSLMKHSIEGMIVKWVDSINDFIGISAREYIFRKEKYPRPEQLINFWEDRLQSLEYMVDQLSDIRIQTIGFLLESLNSVFETSFRSVVEKIMQAFVEARDIKLFVSTLKHFVDHFEINDLNETTKNIRPLLLSIGLVWAHSKYFHTVDNMSLLFFMLHNTLIDCAIRTLEPDTIFQGDIDEAHNRVNSVIAYLECYRKIYIECQLDLQKFKQNTDFNSQDWTWHLKIIFTRFDEFIDRLHRLNTIFEIGISFSKLEKITMGGFNGRTISYSLDLILNEYNNTYREWGNIPFNALDLELNNLYFSKEKETYDYKVDILERRLALLFHQTFADCRELKICGSLLYRPIIKQQLENQFVGIVEDFNNELNDVASDFAKFTQMFISYGIEDISTDIYFPKKSAAISFLTKLSSRITSIKTNFKFYDVQFFVNKFGIEILSRYEQIMKCINELIGEIVEVWETSVTEIIQNKMNQSILKKEENKKNFDKIELLVNYDIEEARVKLMRIVEWYNDINDKANSYESNLLQVEMTEIDKRLVPLLTTFQWNQFDIEYITGIFVTIERLHVRLQQSQNNIDEIKRSIQSWGKKPLYLRKENNPKALLDCNNRVSIIRNRKDFASGTMELIEKLLMLNLKLFFDMPIDNSEVPVGLKDNDSKRLKIITTELIREVPEKKPKLFTAKNRLELLEKCSPARAAAFHKYENYVDKQIAEQLLEAVVISLTYLRMEFENRLGNDTPIFEIVMELQEPNVVFFPSIETTQSHGFLILIEDLIEDIFSQLGMLRRVSSEDIISGEDAKRQDFMDELKERLEIHQIRNDILQKVKYGLQAIRTHVKYYSDYSFIWVAPRDKYLQEIKTYGRLLTPAKRDLSNEDIEAAVLKESYPLLHVYKEQLNKFIALRDEVNKWDIFQDFNVWLRLNKEGFKQNVLNEIGKWINLFKFDLIGQVVNSLQELEDFITEAKTCLLLQLNKEDLDSLLKIKANISTINEKQIIYDDMFDPIKEIVELLKVYCYEFPSIVLTQLADLPDMWLKIKRDAVKLKQTIAPIQTYQVDLIAKRITLFNNMATLFRKRFLDGELFLVTCKDPYSLIDKTSLELTEIEKLQQHLTSSANLFELQGPDLSKIKQCRSDLSLLKQMWDHFICTESTIMDLKTTPWIKIDMELLDLECKKIGKELRGLGKETRLWNPYIYMENSLKNLMTSLRAITELQNPSIKDRHWDELFQTTNVKFNMNDSTTLKDLIDLNLHKYEEEMKNIVDKSVKEMEMEKILGDFQTAWSQIEFGIEFHDRTGLKLITASEEIIETLEDHQVQLQNMISSKFVAYFIRQVTDWQNKLSNADQVISAWFEVQRKWQYQESIFIGSEDIRNQLPEDSKRFDLIDRDFKALLNQIDNDRNVIRSTNRGGGRLYDKLEQILKQLLLCEKALNLYLETKRLTYPRFYFVSSADLLDILSNGNNPKMVSRHLPKLYDSLGSLLLIEGTKFSKGMVAKELEEFVPFTQKCDCSGKVEVWLNRVTDAMRNTLHHHFRQAIVAYEKKPRHIWIIEWPAQPALVTTQIWWTTETDDAFVKISMRYENALKDYSKKLINQLNALITLLLGDLTPGERQKIMTVCTIDVHSRDVISKIIQQKIDVGTAFQWQSQLRHRWDKKYDDCFANICDAQFKYDYEYLGNTPRLVITPLTDRCYITLTQSLHLIMGGAPAGPAGTGKTETTKDLGRALGMMVYVFNCSEQMDYKSCGSIHKGLAQSGAWGCFDEFNRISVEVLSVVAVQVKCIQDAIKVKKTMFNFLGDIIALKATVGMFITMNPGYAGRAELPENLKALYRPCAMVVPDFALICEIMLVAEGFQEARLLARKFISLYTLCKELLSKQDHYDWGLRAIKSVLVVAGSLRRADRHRPEDQVLMRALRDFNTPKIVTDDFSIFIGLIADLFPALDVPRKQNFDFEEIVRKSATDLSLQPEGGFILKIVQLEELFAVRHSVFIIGNAGAGKSAVWKTLFRTYQNQKRKPLFNDLNPKAVTNDELFGIVNPTTREWKDGLFSIIMRDQSNTPGNGPKWIVLDGDIDPMWIESLNTVMDDNKVLTLASNERIAVTKEMRLLFEISNLKTATPATVSRAGILYINPQDLGWNPSVASWLQRRENKNEHSILIVLFEKYVPSLLDVLKTKLKRIIPISDTAMLQMTCYLLDCLLTPQNVPTNCPKEWYEIYFVFSIIWGFGSSLYQDQIIDWRSEFHKWWVNEFKTITFPPEGDVFSYYVDNETKKLKAWTYLVPNFELDADIPLQTNLVHTSETTRLNYFTDILINAHHPIMFIGPPGSGKTLIMGTQLDALPEKKFAVTNVPFNFYTTSEMLQRILEKPLEKKAGRNFGPPGIKHIIYFVDDINMPEVDKYGTVQPHTLIRQFMDYHHWYDRAKMSLKEVHRCQFASCMNPAAGSFTINPRLQRHFCSFAVSAPTGEVLYHILHSILSQHMDISQHKFSKETKDICEPLIRTAIAMHHKISQTFLPTAVKFHYNFNLRDLANIFSGLLYADTETCPNPNMLLRLWVHECNRVYSDKLVEQGDICTYQKLIAENLRKGLEMYSEELVFEKPHIFFHYAKGLSDIKYMPVNNWNGLSMLLEEAQERYNDFVGAMNLVLFEDAMSHVCRINRIIEFSRGYALLIGVGGSGKQSLTRLASFISSLDVFKIQLTKDYSINDLISNIGGLYMKCGIKSNPCCFLMTDTEVAKENFLVVVNDLLASGDIHELFSDEEVENIIAAIRNEVKQAGVLDTRENCWKFFIAKVRRLLKVVLCFSPVGPTLRVRARKFPALVNNTTIDWFHEWPSEALENVAYRFLSEIECLPYHLALPVSKFMAYVHRTVNDISHVYLLNDKRYNYTTPKSFLELLNLYTKLLVEKVKVIQERIVRLENGLIKLASCSQEVDGLQDILKVQEVQLAIQNKEADNLIIVVSAENEKVSKERVFATQEEKKVRKIEEDVHAKALLCEEDFRKAQPVLLAAQEALNTLNKNNLTELKSFGSPPNAVVNVCGAVLVLFAPKGRIPKDRSWKAARVMMGNVDKFLNDLIKYDKKHIQPDVIRALQPYIIDPEFNPEKIVSKSLAAAGLCSWVININRFYEVYLVVEPKERALVDAERELQDARDKLTTLNYRLNELEEKLNILQTDFDNALAKKQKCQNDADKTAFTIDLANRLIGGLVDEKIRWTESVKSLNARQITLPGDILLISCFISYVGCFTRIYRVELQEKLWIPTFKTLKPPIPVSKDSDPFAMICDEAQIAEWNNQGLPSDRMSAENAAILVHSDRYPLMIDPQLQGIKWVKQKYYNNLLVLRLTQRSYLDVVERAVNNGNVLLIENISESIDPVLNSLLGRMLIKKGTKLKLGDKEINFNNNFRLILHTKLANPHYKPEIQAQTTLINFTVTRDGLEDQLLAEVVKAERPDLEIMRANLIQQQNHFKITLKFLEDDLLQRLSSAGENVLQDETVVMNLEKTKKTAEETEIKVAEAKTMVLQIDSAREQYRPASQRASIIYFILNDLCKINPIYQFSLKAYTVVFSNAIVKSTRADNVKMRVENLIDSITFCSFVYVSRGLFEADKLIYLTQITIQILLYSGEVEPNEVDFLLRFPYSPNIKSNVPFLNNISWGGIKALTNLEVFRGLDKDIETSQKRWQKLVDAECPEFEKFPGEWKNKTTIERLCIMRCLRPDRMSYAIKVFIEEKLGLKYTANRMLEFSRTFEESSPETHIFFVLSPGVDPLKDVEKLGMLLGFKTENENLHSVSLGQGQEIIAENAMEIASQSGHWVILQNIHLVARWLPSLEKKIEASLLNVHPDYRLFLSAEPAADPAYHILPQAILESAIKITNEPPTGMQANIHKALDNFSDETLEMCSKETEFKAILFSLCYFHAVVAERRKFGPQGWNRVYPFNVGDLTICVNVLYNYLEANSRVPWEDLRYLIGEIMYGGHITDDWDRKLCRTYLEEFMQQQLVDGELQYCQGFPAPGILRYNEYHEYIDKNIPLESPILYGLHLNAEIGFLTTVTERLFCIVFELQSRLPVGTGSPGRVEQSEDDIVKTTLEDLLDKIPQQFNIYELLTRVGDRNPFIIVAFQECERMNILMRELSRSLKELKLGLKGELTFSSEMENLMQSLYMDQVPQSWTKLAYPSLWGLQLWFADLMLRMKELEGWVAEFKMPVSVWLGGFFNPQSFLTAIMQQTARKNEWPLDRMCLNCDVTNKKEEEISGPPKEGAYIKGLFMEGARWDTKIGVITTAFMKELYPLMPVIFIKAITQDKQDTKNIYECPVYKIRIRGPTFVWTFNLKTREKAAKWTLAGVCLLLQT